MLEPAGKKMASTDRSVALFGEIQTKRLVKVFSLTLMITLLISTIPDVISGFVPGIVASVLGVVATLVIYLVNLKNSRVASHLLIVFGSLMVSFFSLLLGELSGAHYFLIVVILIIPFLVGIENLGTLFFHFAFVACCYLGLELLDFKVYFTLDLKRELPEIFRATNFILVIGLVTATAFFIYQASTRTKQEILDINRQLVEKNSELERLNREMDKFVYTTSHDLKAPIASVLGLINIAKQEKDLSQHYYLNQLKEQRLLHLQKYISDVLVLARNSHQHVQVSRIDLNALLEDLVPGNSDDSFKVSIDIQEEAPFQSDESRIRIIFNNLISNAFTYRDTSKQESELKIAGSIDKTELVINFEDNGIGIAADVLPQIFDMYFTTSGGSRSTGLGLHIVKETLDRLGGNITVDTEVGRGSVFTLRIPNNVK